MASRPCPSGVEDWGASSSEVCIWDVAACWDRGRGCESYRPAAGLATVTCGGGLAAFITEDQHLYLMDLRRQPQRCGSPRLVEALRGAPVTAVSCGPRAVIAACDGMPYLLSVGEDSAHRQEGLAGRLAVQGVPLRLDLPERVSRISCGGSHALLTTSRGELFAYGSGPHGQLGLPDVSTTQSPKLVQALAHLQILDVAAGATHSCVATSFGNVFCWGDNRRGQLGDGTMDQSTSPVLLGTLRGVRAVVASTLSAAMCEDGSVYAWGFQSNHSPVRIRVPYACLVALGDEMLSVVGRGGGLTTHQLGFPDAQLRLESSGVWALAAAGPHVVAVRRDPQDDGLWPHDSFAGSSPVGGLDLSDGELRREIAEEGRRLDDLRTEHFHLDSRLAREVELAHDRTMSAGLRLAEVRAQVLRLCGLAQTLEKWSELAVCRAEIARMVSEEEQAAESSPTAHAAVAGQGVERQLLDRFAQLAGDNGALCRESGDLQAEFTSARRVLSDTTQRLRRIDTACEQATEVLERQREEAAQFREHSAMVEAEWAQTVEAMRPHDPADTQQWRERVQQAAEYCCALVSDVEALQVQEEELDSETRTLREIVGSAIEGRRSLQLELRELAQRHDEVEQQAARQRLELESLEGRLALARSEAQLWEGQRRDWDERAVAARAEEACQEKSGRLRARLHGVRSAMRASQDQILSELRKALEGLEDDQMGVEDALHAQATNFNDMMEPLYKELQELHCG